MVTPVSSPALTPGDRVSTLASGGFFSDELVGLSSGRRWLFQCCLAGSASGVTPFLPVRRLASRRFSLVSIIIGMALPSPIMGWFIFGFIRINKDDMFWIGSF
ncbi:hypothetical protein HID58_010170 [Brassica napus]|uniref:Uncharacterized protein n=1 Tax=Brassica napus TaxID=3708 RepID=A0ABQ8DWI4_BRANA|nr:hypothetical protein HID58_010170 [Brassica napus]